ncbi:TonB-dependent siderophore receptor [Microbulbifer litoralis]|uniref:TonB-dependent siderophore receptor n=1 Tax=Microbulbifer litoralis TaxID=2933965 RepID=UPI0020290DE8|nr:TonB-dependent siderophore receptor [Microbulbifer sp. GX H0434]
MRKACFENGTAENSPFSNLSQVVGLSGLALAIAVASGSANAQSGGQGEKAKSLEEVSVTEELNLSRQTSIGKLDVPVSETPFSVSLRSKAFMDEVGAKSVQDTLQYFAGVNGGTYGIDSRGDWSTVRGVDPVLFIDGLQSLFGSYNGARANAYAFERVEVMKGPSSVLYGQGSTGGIVNLVSKRPQREFGGEVLVQAGDYDRKVLAGDVSGVLDSDGEWAYRLVGYQRDADAQVDYVEDNSLLLMPSVSWRPSEDTEVTFLTSYQKDETGTTAAFLPWGGTRIDNANGDIATDTFLSEPGWDKYDTEQTAYSLWADHRINDNWGINASVRYSEGEVDYNSMYADFGLSRLNPDIREVSRTVYMSDASSDLLIFDVRANGTFNTGALEHQFSIGVDSQDATIDNDRISIAGGGGTIDIFDPVYGNLPGNEIQPLDQPETTTEQLGFYLQDQVRLYNWIFTGGLRRDSVESGTRGGNSQEDDATTGRLGVMYAFDGGISPYLSYTESFEPVGGADSADRPFKPVEGEQFEAGVKYQPAGTNLLLTAAAYEIKQKNRLTPDPENPGFDVQTGEVTIDGVELEASGNWGNFTLVANYSTTNTEVSESNNPLELGTELVAVPEQQLSLWGSYEFSDWLPGLDLGFGVRHVGESYTGVDNVAYIPEAFPADNPDYTLYDATIGYTLDSWKFQLNAKNLTDEIHTTSCLYRGDCFYGERRYVTAEARYTF